MVFKPPEPRIKNSTKQNYQPKESNIEKTMKKNEEFMNNSIFGVDGQSSMGYLTDVENPRLKVRGGGRRIFSYGAKLTEDKSRAKFKWM